MEREAGAATPRKNYLLPKPVHMAKLLSEDGRVSPLCAKTPRALNLKIATWTIRPDAVTCPRCLAAATATDPTPSAGGGA